MTPRPIPDDDIAPLHNVTGAVVMEPSELIHRRERLGLSQGKLAEVLGVTRPLVSMCEAGERDIRGWMDLALRCLEYEAGIMKLPRRKR